MTTHSTVYWLKFKTSDPIHQTQERLKQLFYTAGLDGLLETNDHTAIKVHFGEKQSDTFVAPVYVRPLVQCIREKGAKPFLTDTNVLYKSVRDNAVTHLELAYEHGFTYEQVGAPVIIADGIKGINETAIEINAPLNKTVSLATEFVSANSIIVISHATGHINAGLGATIKNMGMGMASRKGKLTQHSLSKPRIDTHKCNACGICAQWCPSDAIVVGEQFALINTELCIGCGECITMCRSTAIRFRWDNTSVNLQRQIAEHALGIIKAKRGKIGFVTFLINMTKDCDCLTGKQKPILPDLGALAGLDPVAIDQAVLDLTSQFNQKSLSELAYPNNDASEQIRYGEQIGLGSRQYQLIECNF